MIFKLIQKNFAFIGITVEQSIQAHPFNGRILFGFLLCGVNIFHQYMFLFTEARGFR